MTHKRRVDKLEAHTPKWPPNFRTPTDADVAVTRAQLIKLIEEQGGPTPNPTPMRELRAEMEAELRKRGLLWTH